MSLLGPLRVESPAGAEALLGAAKERSLLAALALTPGVVQSPDALIAAIWGDRPPASARKTLQTYVSNLRQALGPDAVSTDAAGYALDVAAQDVDVCRFRERVREGESALRAGSVAAARAALAEATQLWRGEPFAGVAPHTGLAAAGIRLREEYLTALETRFDADLAAGGGGELVGELEALVRDHPFRERLWGHLMVALFRSGRQADALAAYQRVRTMLREELGLEPGGELQRLEHAVLTQDPSLSAPGEPSSPTPPPGDVRRSPVRYAVTADGVHIAYQIVGNGPIDVLAVPGFVSHLDMWWDAPTDRLVRELATFSRLIIFDKRGMGMSDRPPNIDVEHWVDDACAVLDAAGATQAVVLGISAGGATAALLAATHPERVRALIICGGFARVVAGEGYEHGLDPAAVDGWVQRVEAGWGTGAGLTSLAPSQAKDPAARRYWARLQSLGTSPAAAAAFLRALTLIDVRHALPAIAAPTLVVHARDDRNVPIAAAREVQRLIPGARLVELDSDVHLIWLSDVMDDITANIERFITSTTPAFDHDRALATVLALAPPEPSAHHQPLIESIIERSRGRAFAGAARAAFDGPARAIRCALTVAAEVGRHGVAVHSGECELASDRLQGVAVDVAAHIAASARPGEVLVSQTVRDLVLGSGIALQPHSRRAFDGVPGEWDIFAVSASGDA